jgi:DTW domain-containing protein
MTRRKHAARRCARCRMHASLCVCALIPRIETRTRLLVVIHRVEDRRPSNTGRLAAACLANSEVIVRGDAMAPTAPLAWPEGSHPLLLFPHEDAIPLDTLPPLSGPLTLIVPDGNWRQASRVRNRVPNLRDAICVSLPPGRPSAYRLRAESEPGRLATIEAVSRALAILEGSPVADAIERVFLAMVERTLWSRGDLDAEDVTCGVPEGAMRHDPSSGLARPFATPPAAPRDAAGED